MVNYGSLGTFPPDLAVILISESSTGTLVDFSGLKLLAVVAEGDALYVFV
jgi:hypothetical protein